MHWLEEVLKGQELVLPVAPGGRRAQGLERSKGSFPSGLRDVRKRRLTAYAETGRGVSPPRCSTPSDSRCAYGMVTVVASPALLMVKVPVAAVVA